MSVFIAHVMNVVCCNKHCKLTNEYRHTGTKIEQDIDTEKKLSIFTPTFKLMSMFICKFCHDHLNDNLNRHFCVVNEYLTIKFRYFWNTSTCNAYFMPEMSIESFRTYFRGYQEIFSAYDAKDNRQRTTFSP
jgi:hypothetical protein